MFVSVRTYRFGAGSMNDLMHRVDRDFADALALEPGFVAYQAIATGEDTLMSVSVFRTREDAERSNDLAAQWVADDLADFDIHRMGAIPGEVMVSRAAAAMLEPAHH